MWTTRLALRFRSTAPVALGAVSAGALYAAAQCQAAEPAPVGLNPKAWTPLTLTKITPLSANSAVYRFAFEDPEATSGMTVASMLMTKAAIGSEKADGTRANVIRPYTPISRPDEKGYLELAVKSYPDGKMSKHIASLRVGDKLDFKGPVVKLPYKPNNHSHIGMVAGGTGIAPMLQVLDEVLDNPADKTQVSLIFANVSEHDILLKRQLDAREALYPDRVSIYYVVDKAPVRAVGEPAWQGGVGYVTAAMLRSKLPPPSDLSMVYVCGPPPMYKAICGAKATKETPDDPKKQGELSGFLKELGYTSDNVFKF